MLKRRVRRRTYDMWQSERYVSVKSTSYLHEGLYAWPDLHRNYMLPPVHDAAVDQEQRVNI